MRFGVCNKALVPLYGKPMFCEGHSEAVSGVADELLYGWKCQILDETVNCLKVRTEYGYRGYARREDVLVLPEKADDKEGFVKKNISAENLFAEADNTAKFPEDDRYYVNHNFADILSMPGVQGKVLMTLYRGSYVRVADFSAAEDGWAEVRLHDGGIGFIPKIFLRELKKPVNSYPSVLEFRKAVIQSAMAYLGVQYRWGGKTPLGIDCSGLAFMSYFENGVFIFRDSRIEAGYPVKKIPSHLMDKGDLLYFPGHVAIYLGEGKYIHATAHKDSFGVVINSLYPWDKEFRLDLCEKLEAVGSIF